MKVWVSERASWLNADSLQCTSVGGRENRVRRCALRAFIDHRSLTDNSMHWSDVDIASLHGCLATSQQADWWTATTHCQQLQQQLAKHGWVMERIDHQCDTASWTPTPHCLPTPAAQQYGRHRQMTVALADFLKFSYFLPPESATSDITSNMWQISETVRDGERERETEREREREVRVGVGVTVRATATARVIEFLSLTVPKIQRGSQNFKTVTWPKSRPFRGKIFICRQSFMYCVSVQNLERVTFSAQKLWRVPNFKFISRDPDNPTLGGNLSCQYLLCRIWPLNMKFLSLTISKILRGSQNLRIDKICIAQRMRSITWYISSRWNLIPYLIFLYPYFIFNMQPLRSYHQQ